MPKTKIIDDVMQAAEALRHGSIVAFPTETVYGLGVDATNEAAVKRLFAAKGRPSDNPLIVHIGSSAQWTLAAAKLTKFSEKLMQVFSPGPLTVVVDKASAISTLVTAGLRTVGVRIPGLEQARQLLDLSARPIAAPSANRSGRPSCTTWQSVLEDMDGRIDYILRGDVCAVGLESTVVDCTGAYPIILRAGKITLPQIQQVIPSARMYTDQLGKVGGPIASPGVRHNHYQPRATVHLWTTNDELRALTTKQQSRAAVIGLTVNRAAPNDLLAGFSMVKTFESIEQFAREFYESLRQVDRCGLESVYVQLVDESDQSAALRDRQLRAAGKS